MSVRRTGAGALTLAVAALLFAVKGCGDGNDPVQTTPPPPPPPPPPSVARTLDVAVGGHGAGTVTSQPAGIDCRKDGGVCAASFPDGTQVTLTAAPDPGMEFAGWNGGCSGAGACALAMSADRNVGADFGNPALVAAEIGAGGGEIVSVDGNLRLAIPPGALDETVVITIETLDPTTVPLRYLGTVEAVGDPPSGEVDEPPSAAWRLGPEGTEFDEPAEVTVELDAAAGSVAVWLLSGDDIEPADVLDVFPEADGRLTLTVALRHFSIFSTAPVADNLTAEFALPEEGANFGLGQSFPWAVEVRLNPDVVNVYRSAAMPGHLFYTELNLTGQWVASRNDVRWSGAIQQRILAGLASAPDPASPVEFEGFTACGNVAGDAAAFTEVMAFLPQRVVIIDPDGAVAEEVLTRRWHRDPASRSVTCRQASSFVLVFRQHHPNGAQQITRGFVLELLPTGEFRLVTGGTFEVYWGALGGSTVLFLAFGQAGAIPSSGNLDEEAARAINDAFEAHLTEPAEGLPFVDWPAVFQALGIDPSKVCGGRVVLDTPADQGGLLPGFDGEGKLSGSGTFTGQTAGCTNFNITLTGEIEGS